MLKWVQGGYVFAYVFAHVTQKLFADYSVSALTGAAEPEYGAEAFRSVDSTVKGKNPYGELKREDLEWRAPYSSNVETQTFYYFGENGYYGFVQVIHSSPVGLHFTAQFTCLIVNDSKPDFKIWTSTHLEGFEAKGTTFKAEGLTIELNDDATEYKITSVVNEETLVELTMTRTAPGFKIGADGTSAYGEDLSKPWGTMRHVFWPRAVTKGKIVTKEAGEIAVDGRAMYVMALQGMKPHHAAAKWNFLNYQGPTYSAVVMEFETPVSYGSSRSSIGAVARDGELLATAVDVEFKHLDAAEDDVGWPAPKGIEFTIKGPKPGVPDADIDKPENQVTAVVSGRLDRLVDRVDVMAEIPTFVKRLASGVSGARPYIYQYSNKLQLSLTVDGKETTEEAHTFSEATFIS